MVVFVGVAASTTDDVTDYVAWFQVNFGPRFKDGAYVE
jgi:hypothetical protein